MREFLAYLRRSNHVIALKTVIVYVVFGSLWIIFSDRLLLLFVESPQQLTALQTVKGWLFVVVTAIILYTVISQYARQISNLNRSLESRIKERTAQLENTNRELESFSYSVSHDLRAPLRRIDGFSTSLLDEYENELGSDGRTYLEHIHNSVLQMKVLIEDLLKLSRITREELSLTTVNLSLIAEQAIQRLRQDSSGREVQVEIQPGITATGDPHLLEIMLTNLLGNAWKFTRNNPAPHIAFGVQHKDEEQVYYVKDNGIGFDMEYAEQLFVPFKRLHSEADYEGSGIGLAIVQRIIARHNGRVWAQSQPGQGAVFFFTLALP